MIREIVIQPTGEERTPKKFREPANLDEAEQRRLDLIDKLNNINTQLTQRNGARDETGAFLEDAHSFFDWRNRAVMAKRYVESDLRRLNFWIKQQRRAAPIHAAASLGVNPDAMGMLRAAYDLLHRLACDGVDLDPDEQVVLDAVREFLNTPQEPQP